jgi:hypothetical protein
MMRLHLPAFGVFGHRQAVHHTIRGEQTMQRLRQILAIAAITCALTFNTFAGEMHYPYVPPTDPTPTPEQATSTSTASDSSSVDTSYDYFGEVVWSILESLNLAS